MNVKRIVIKMMYLRNVQILIGANEIQTIPVQQAQNVTRINDSVDTSSFQLLL